MQGWRISMEDAHACVLDLKADTKDKKLSPSKQRLSYFGVYDGHGGDKVAIYTGDNLHRIIAKQNSFRNGDIEQALKDGFLATDRAILSDPKYEEEVSGCTSSVGIISSDKIYVGNAGDSRSVLGIKGRAKPLSFDHKPQNEGEKARIVAAGGFVDFGRVNGNLALSRAIGDFEFKKSADLPPEQQIVTAFPDVTVHDISADDEFLVVACDGIWDCQSSQAVIEFVRRGIAAKQELHVICENLMDNCLAANCDTGGVGCDNMTVVIVGLLNGRSKEEWYNEIAERVANGDGPCAPPEYAELRGPGMHHRSEDAQDDYDMDMENHRSQGLGQLARALGGRIILLGDGTELSNEAGDSEMFDHIDEDKDLEEQIHRTERITELPEESDATRAQREDTPAPTGAPAAEKDQSAPSSTTETGAAPSSTETKKEASS
ncbi:PP2C-domain-containing protein [Eremomyces bilateralis CBS 781.70]|uniref:Protein phosphatase 2C homolog 2 n=1 Tax=Eremomyces bilateralis CBS 781.70 TaxID=1392243 RepID=A0A6G1G8W2_9PEZI|nr:PP2C-domain-containing protein [Eremomyces bilateralis CBS 781.70]KAF1814422.1 PP2C-domain-containing protein [Eremomyces bilateralis CBS 781.70]